MDMIFFRIFMKNSVLLLFFAIILETILFICYSLYVYIVNVLDAHLIMLFYCV